MHMLCPEGKKFKVFFLFPLCITLLLSNSEETGIIHRRDRNPSGDGHSPQGWRKLASLQQKYTKY